jgi:glutaconate CoA-transferase subunit A
MSELTKRNKITPLSEAIDTHVHDGDTLCLANFASPVANSAIHEIIRQGKRDLTIILASSYFEMDSLSTAGCVKKLIHSFHFHPFSGDRPFDRAVRKYGIEVVDYTNYTVAAMLMAGAMNVPFFAATPSLMATDLYRRGGDKKFRVIDNPFNEGEKVVLVPAVKPDVSILHVQRVDTAGNAQLWGPTGTQKDGAMCAKRIIVTAEELADREVVNLSPFNTIIPGFKVDVACIEPWGGHPIDCLGYYDLDLQFCAMLSVMGRSEEDYANWMNEWVYGVKNRREYIEHYADRFGVSRLHRLQAKSLPSSPVNLGSSFMTDYEVRGIPRDAVDKSPDLFEVEVSE